MAGPPCRPRGVAGTHEVPVPARRKRSGLPRRGSAGGLRMRLARARITRARSSCADDRPRGSRAPGCRPKTGTKTANPHRSEESLSRTKSSRSCSACRRRSTTISSSTERRAAASLAGTPCHGCPLLRVYRLLSVIGTTADGGLGGLKMSTAENAPDSSPVGCGMGSGPEGVLSRFGVPAWIGRDDAPLSSSLTRMDAGCRPKDGGGEGGVCGTPITQH